MSQEPETMLRFEIPYLPPRVLSPNSRAHWSTQRRERLRIKGDVTGLVLEQGWSREPLEHSKVTINFGFPDNRMMDWDNLIANGMIKAILDALTGKMKGIDAHGKANGPWLPYRFVLQEDDRKHLKLGFDQHDSPKRPVTIIEVEAA